MVHKKMKKIPFEKDISDLKKYGELYISLRDKEIDRTNSLYNKLKKL